MAENANIYGGKRQRQYKEVRETKRESKKLPPTPIASQRGSVPHRRQTRKQRRALVGIYDPERDATPTTFPDDPRAQEISDRIAHDDKTLTLSDLGYFHDAQAQEKRKRIQ